MSFSVVILSKNFTNLRACVEAIHRTEPGGARLVIVDDGLEDSGYIAGTDDYESGALLDGSTIICGEKPFIFARNANIGIRAAGEDDVILLNDDALLKTPGGFTALQKVAEENPDFGVIAATCNNV